MAHVVVTPTGMNDVGPAPALYEYGQIHDLQGYNVTLIIPTQYC